MENFIVRVINHAHWGEVWCCALMSIELRGVQVLQRDQFPKIVPFIVSNLGQIDVQIPLNLCLDFDLLLTFLLKASFFNDLINFVSKLL